MTQLAASTSRHPRVVALIEDAIGLLERVPYTLLALLLRVGAAAVFWLSGQAHLANWDTTIEQFTEDYKVPLLPPDIAAYMAVSIEVAMPVLLVIGFFTRAAALVLIGMTTVIEVFVYPQAWPTHIQWVAMLLVLLCRGPGTLSFDHLFFAWWRRLLGTGSSARKWSAGVLYTLACIGIVIEGVMVLEAISIRSALGISQQQFDRTASLLGIVSMFSLFAGIWVKPKPRYEPTSSEEKG
jgi:putative oxidoreductase